MAFDLDDEEYTRDMRKTKEQLIDELHKEKEKNKEYDYALCDMFLQFAYSINKDKLYTGGLSTLENTIAVLNIGNKDGIVDVKEIEKRMNN